MFQTKSSHMFFGSVESFLARGAQDEGTPSLAKSRTPTTTAGDGSYPGTPVRINMAEIQCVRAIVRVSSNARGSVEGVRHQDCRPTHSVERPLTESGAKGTLIGWRGCIKVTQKESMTRDWSDGSCKVKFSAGRPERGRFGKNFKRKRYVLEASGPRGPRRGGQLLVWFRGERCEVIVDLISDVDERQPALV